MAPIPSSLSAIHTLFTTLTRRTTSTSTTTPIPLHPRSSTDFTHGSGTIQPTSVPTAAIFALIGLICAGFILTAIWFFFIAKNGGFHFRQGDWEDYKSTVLRRKGPNGTTLSGATRTTDLGGGSVVGKRYRDSDSSVSGSAYSEQTESLVGTETVVSEMTSITRGVSGRFQKEKTERSSAAASSAAKKEQRKRFREKGDKREKSRLRNAESVAADELEGDDLGDAAMRSYRHEKPARVGGMNRAADGSAFESSVGGSEESAAGLLAGREATPTNSPQKARRVRERGGEYGGSPSASPSKERGGIRKVETVREADRVKAEARRLREKGRSAAGAARVGGRRDFSYTPGDDLGSSVGGSSTVSGSGSGMPGGYVDSEVSADTGTKTYKHVIPGLSGAAAPAGKESYAEERRRRRAER
ncbi:hypothetical protein VE02_08030 [Pseudogymnoascus sp. 03VT05]|nr:hypothetical protein VE02_08030 [Pseudogymnoascus sp. 03VT05]